MSSVLKIFSNLKGGHIHSKKDSKKCSQDQDGCEGVSANELLNRRRVSISKSGRYKENHKRRAMLREANEEEKNEKNKENEQNQLNCKRDTIDLDGHAVADEIEYLAKTIEAKTNLGLT